MLGRTPQHFKYENEISAAVPSTLLWFMRNVCGSVLCASAELLTLKLNNLYIE